MQPVQYELHKNKHSREVGAHWNRAKIQTSTLYVVVVLLTRKRKGHHRAPILNLLTMSERESYMYISDLYPVRTSLADTSYVHF